MSVPQSTGLPPECDRALEGAVADLRGLFDSDLLSVALFGSGARGEFDPKRSDLNLLVVLTQADYARLKRIAPILKSWRKKRISTPLVMDPAYIRTAQDVFPMEFLEMKWAHRVLHGPDPLESVNPSREAVRRQCEQEARGKLLHLRKVLLETGLDAKRLMEAARLAAPAFVRIGRALLFLKGATQRPHDDSSRRPDAGTLSFLSSPPYGGRSVAKGAKPELRGEDVLKGLEREWGLSLKGFSAAWSARSGERVAAPEPAALFEQLLADAEALVARVDSLPTA